MKLKSFVRFHGPFDEKIPEKEMPGKVLSGFLQEKLKGRDIPVLQVEDSQIEHGFRCSVDGREFWIHIYFSEDDENKESWWEIGFNPNKNSLKESFRGAPKVEWGKLARTIDEVLKGFHGIKDVRWYDDPLGDPDEDYSPSPDSHETTSNEKGLEKKKKPFSKYLKVADLYSTKVFPLIFFGVFFGLIVNSIVNGRSPKEEWIRGLLGRTVLAGLALWMGLQGLGIVWGLLAAMFKGRKDTRGRNWAQGFAFLATGLTFLFCFGMIVMTVFKK